MYKFVRFPEFKLKALTLSYDDANRQDKRLIAIMKQHGLKGTFNINSGAYGEKYQGEEKGRMSKQEAIDLYTDSGMEVAVHGNHHINLTKVPIELAIDEIMTDRKDLEKTFNRVVKGMAYAYGAYDDQVVDMLKKCGIEYSRTTICTGKFDLPTDWLRLQTTCHHKDECLMDFAKQFVEKKEDSRFWRNDLSLFYLWGHSYEFDNDDNWGVIEKFAEYVGNRDDIWYATNGDIFAYLKSAEKLCFSLDGKLVQNPTAIDIYIDYVGQKCVVPAGKTVRIENGEIL